MTLILDLNIWLKITANPLTKVQLMWSMCRIYDTEIFVKTSLIWPWPKNFVQGHCTIFDQGTLLVKYKPDWIKRKEYMIQSRFFFLYNSAMTLTLDLETWFKVIAHPLPKDTQWVKYEPDWAKVRERKNAPNKWSQMDGQQDGWMDGQIDHYRVAAEWSLIISD